MKSLFKIFLFFFVFGTLTGVAQEEVRIEVQDTVSTKINPLSPAKAAFYSALVPGLGQAYNKKYWKIPIVYIGLGSGIYFYTWNNKKYHEFRDEYKRRLDGTSDPNHPIYGGLDNDRLIRAQQFHQRNRDLSALITAGIYILNIIDANVDAHLMQFNVNDNLSVAPDLYQNQIDYKYNTGLKLTYNF
ncbi:DUF5683 domain-containing protein [Flavobacterium okayamense]|uniref:DUF5683 domain-containing protein n=1 Tax=Flavobacterium okayamense TaxID=2830782 RepID=A0ABM7S763_9FLAO|nr:DUF5683 domain-containing protein [Flavobacterium okayamense]BCY28483.1 hypothetical protein KK2020170_13510 [Flavobacterium okayamense]